MSKIIEKKIQNNYNNIHNENDDYYKKIIKLSKQESQEIIKEYHNYTNYFNKKSNFYVFLLSLIKLGNQNTYEILKDNSFFNIKIDDNFIICSLKNNNCDDFFKNFVEIFYLKEKQQNFSPFMLLFNNRYINDQISYFYRNKVKTYYYDTNLYKEEENQFELLFKKINYLIDILPEDYISCVKTITLLSIYLNNNIKILPNNYFKNISNKLNKNKLSATIENIKNIEDFLKNNLKNNYTFNYNFINYNLLQETALNNLIELEKKYIINEISKNTNKQNNNSKKVIKI